MSEMITINLDDIRAGSALDWLVAKAIIRDSDAIVINIRGVVCISKEYAEALSIPSLYDSAYTFFNPSTKWGIGGILIDKFDAWIKAGREPGTQISCLGRSFLDQAYGKTKFEAACKAIFLGEIQNDDIHFMADDDIHIVSVPKRLIGGSQ
jgi:hypothetical protein